MLRGFFTRIASRWLLSIIGIGGLFLQFVFELIVRSPVRAQLFATCTLGPEKIPKTHGNSGSPLWKCDHESSIAGCSPRRQNYSPHFIKGKNSVSHCLSPLVQNTFRDVSEAPRKDTPALPGGTHQPRWSRIFGELLQTGWVRGEFLILPSSAPELGPNPSCQLHGVLRLIETDTGLNSLVGQDLLSVSEQSIPPTGNKKLLTGKLFIFSYIAS